MSIFKNLRGVFFQSFFLQLDCVGRVIDDQSWREADFVNVKTNVCPTFGDLNIHIYGTVLENRK